MITDVCLNICICSVFVHTINTLASTLWTGSNIFEAHIFAKLLANKIVLLCAKFMTHTLQMLLSLVFQICSPLHTEVWLLTWKHVAGLHFPRIYEIVVDLSAFRLYKTLPIYHGHLPVWGVSVSAAPVLVYSTITSGSMDVLPLRCEVLGLQIF